MSSNNKEIKDRRSTLKEDVLKQSVRHVLSSGENRGHGQGSGILDAVAGVLFLMLLVFAVTAFFILPTVLAAGLLVGALYLVVCIVGFLVAVILDLICAASDEWRARRRWKRSVRNSPFPSFERLHRSDCIFRGKPTTCSEGRRPSIPEQGDHQFQAEADQFGCACRNRWSPCSGMFE